MQDVHIPENPEERSKYVQTLFDSISGTYDLLNTFLSVGIDQYWRKKIVWLAEVPRGGRVLDLCTGTGKVVFDFAKWSPADEIIGLDFAYQMIELARKELKNKPRLTANKKIQFLQGDAIQLPFENDYFDAVSSAFGLRNVVNVEKYFEEKYRVTKPGGRNLTLELTRPISYVIRLLYYPYLHGYLPIMGRLISKNPSAYIYLAKTISEFHSPEKIIEIMQSVGWKQATAIPLTGGITTIYYGVK